MKSRIAVDSLLPDDLVQFLRAGRTLKYDAKKVIPGKIAFKSFDTLRVGSVYAAPTKRGDPNLKLGGIYRIPAISLIDKCQRYDPAYILSYLPLERVFAAFDPDHAIVTVFPGATWSAIEVHPIPYLNAQWESWDGQPGVKVKRNVDWSSRYHFSQGAFY
jgi:hypothetical protein